MARALSGHGPLVGVAVLLVLAGGIAVAATVGATPQPATPQLGPPVVLAPSSTTGLPPRTSSGEGPESSHSSHHAEHGDEAEVVGPAPVQEHDDDEAAEATRTSTHG